MAMNKTNRATVEIDEGFLLQSIKDKDSEKKKKEEKVETGEIGEAGKIGKIGETAIATPVPQDAAEPVPEKPKEAKRRRSHADYSSLFLQRNELKERSCVYISRRIHTTISEIVRVIADRDVTVGGYIDNVLLQHLETHRDEINNLYRRERKDLVDL
jgi:hypothetical protein